MMSNAGENRMETPAHGKQGFRLEIQGLRAIAVMLVVIYHLWPRVIPGGYVGVDVFFVISGFLITGMLVREMQRDGRIALGRFYARRIKRLLPAATLTLIAIAIASFFFLPKMHWQGTAMEVVASALYYENWWLAWQAVDYLDADTIASPARHFWSLSVEEQYYIAWPLLLLGIGFIFANNHQRLNKWLLPSVALIFVASLAYSIWLTVVQPEFAYFATTTRAWELAIGGVLALVMQRWSPGQKLRLALGIVGAGMILAAGFFFNKNTAFPGYAALLPTMGAASVILSGTTTALLGVYTLLRTRLFQFFGNISYSLYLWHWPVIIFYGHITNAKPSWLSGLGLLLLAIVLATLSKYLVEDPIHKSPLDANKLWKPYAMGAGFILACLLSAAILWGVVELRGLAVGHGARQAARPGAAVMMPGYPYDFVPALETAREDRPDLYSMKCHASLKVESAKPCEFGRADAKYVVALVGDSHAAQWSPALQELVGTLDMRLLTYTRSACAFMSAEWVDESVKAYKACKEHNRQVLAQLLELKPNLVIASSMSPPPKKVKNREKTVEGMIDAWSQLQANGIRIMAIRDTPNPGDRLKVGVPVCLAQAGNRMADCSVPRSKALRPKKQDPISIVAGKLEDVRYVDMTDGICSVAACDPVVGGIVVWGDGHHMTATYVRTLAPRLLPEIEAALKQK
jgi:peptidoglycan/LPS O-acetylase OafA/YrhL